MYVLVSPCILDPSLRARGITREENLAWFRRARDRCEAHSLNMVPYPCPECLFLGRDREPGTFYGRLDNPAFEAVLAKCESAVHEQVAMAGPPTCIVGVDSSPCCGVNRAWYGPSGDLNGRRPGRGVFLSRFPGISAQDVRTFGRFRLYLAAPLFSDAEKRYNLIVEESLRSRFYSVYLPQEIGDDTAARGKDEHQSIFLRHREALKECDAVVAIIDGADADSGTSWEMGYAYALGKPVVALRTDFRLAGHHEQVNLMLEQSAYVVNRMEDIPAVLETIWQETER